MDEMTLSACLEHLEAAETLMNPNVDGWHLARLSHVIEALKEAYTPPRRPPGIVISTVQ
jgi:hypothetical protein